MPETAQVQLIITFGSIISAIVTAGGIVLVAMLNRTRQHAKVAADQTKNSHETNLRDDLDEKFLDLTVLVRGAVADIGGMKSDIRQIHRDASDDRDALAKERERIRALEETTPTRPSRRPTTKPNKEH
ncbi:MAG: hypothetical protein ACOH1M_07190 [Rhodoglobus sp.]